MTFDQLFTQIELSIKQGQLKTALENLMKIANHPTTPILIQAKVHYDIGVLFCRHIGNGVKARMHFKTAEDILSKIGLMADPRIEQLTIFNWENLLLLSISYEEFDALVNKIKKPNAKCIASSMTIGILEEIKMKQRPWADIMGFMAGYAHEQNDFLLMASIFQLMMSQRRGLRLSRIEWKAAVRTYGEAIRHILAWHGDRIVKEKQTRPEEVVFIGKDALEILKDYLKENEYDKEAREIIDDIEMLIKDLNSLKV